MIIFFQQAIEEQLSYEEATRKTLSALNEKLANMVAIFEEAKGEKLIQHIPSLSKAVLASLSSPLAMGHCQQLWGVLCHSVFKQWTLGKRGIYSVLSVLILRFCQFFSSVKILGEGD